jgi:5-dehydro-2-deoxygluconokinase
MLSRLDQLTLTHSQVSDARVGGNIDEAIDALLALGPHTLIEKRGAEGARVHLSAEADAIDAPGFPVEVYNILGAGMRSQQAFSTATSTIGAGTNLRSWAMHAARLS